MECHDFYGVSDPNCELLNSLDTFLHHDSLQNSSLQDLGNFLKRISGVILNVLIVLNKRQGLLTFVVVNSL